MGRMKRHLQRLASAHYRQWDRLFYRPASHAEKQSHRRIILKNDTAHG